MISIGAPPRLRRSSAFAAACLLIVFLGCASKRADALYRSGAFVHNIVYSERIAIFSKINCSYAIEVKEIFEKLEEKPFVVELDDRRDGREIQRVLLDSFGSYMVPQVFINGQHVGDSEETVIALENGKLKELLEKN